MSLGAGHTGSPVEHPARITVLPLTDLGWWAVGFAAAFIPLVFAAAVVPRAALLGFACGLGGGAIALVAIIRKHERAVSVFAALAPLVIAVAFVLAELISGNA